MSLSYLLWVNFIVPWLIVQGRASNLIAYFQIFKRDPMMTSLNIMKNSTRRPYFLGGFLGFRISMALESPLLVKSLSSHVDCWGRTIFCLHYFTKFEDFFWASSPIGVAKEKRMEVARNILFIVFLWAIPNPILVFHEGMNFAVCLTFSNPNISWDGLSAFPSHQF